MSPPSARIEPGNQLEIKCTLPSASPPAARSWKKDTQFLEPSSSLTLTKEGSLIIHSVKVSDSGNYACVAINIAGQRVSSTVPVVVRSEKRWSEWTTCSSDCVKFRTRNCGSKSPSDCVGKEVETADCADGNCRALVNNLNSDNNNNAYLIYIFLIFVIVVCVLAALIFAHYKKKKPEIPDYIVTDNGELALSSPLPHDIVTSLINVADSKCFMHTYVLVKSTQETLKDISINSIKKTIFLSLILFVFFVLPSHYISVVVVRTCIHRNTRDSAKEL